MKLQDACIGIPTMLAQQRMQFPAHYHNALHGQYVPHTAAAKSPQNSSIATNAAAYQE